jgi:hypothetical protein
VQLALRVEQIEERHLEQHAQLSRAEYGELAAVSQIGHLRWKFLENPQGPSVGIHLYDREELVGRAVALNRSFLHNGGVFRAAHIVDLLVHRDYRGMTPLFQLITGIKQLNIFDFLLIMAPNPAGAAVWEKFWKMRAYFELDAAVVPIRPVSLLRSRGMLSNSGLAPVVDLPWRALLGAVCQLFSTLGFVELDKTWPTRSELDALFVEASSGRTIGIRTAQYLEWRYRNCPVFQYEPIFLRKRGRLVGYLVTRRAAHDGMDCAFVVDAFGAPDIRRELHAASLSVIKRAASSGSEIAMLIGNTATGHLAAIKRLPFLSLPPRRLPRKLTVFAEWIGSPKFEIGRDQFCLALGDSDVV